MVMIAAGLCEGLVVDGWLVTFDAMLISLSYSDSHEVSGTEAVTDKGLSGDYNAEDLNSPFILM